MRTRFLAAAPWVVALAVAGPALAEDDSEGPLSSKTFEGLKLRNIGPALMSGRIADIAIQAGRPRRPGTWRWAPAASGRR